MTPQELRNQMLREAGIDPISYSFNRPQGSATVQSATPSYWETLKNQRDAAFGKVNSLGNKAYDFSRSSFGVDPTLPRSGSDPAAMKTAGKQAAFADLNPRSLGGLFNYGMAGVSGVSNFISNANQGMDFDDNLARTTGGVAGNLAGGSIGAGLGTAAAIPLAAIPVIGPALAAASPYVGSYLGSKFLGNAGTSVAGGAWDLIDKDDSYSKLGEERPIEGLGDYAQYLNPESQKALAEYMAFTDAQQGLERGQMGYLADLERQKFDHAAKTQFQNDAAMSALNAKATLEQDRQRGQMEMLMNNSNNFWNGYNSNADLMSRIYAS